MSAFLSSFKGLCKTGSGEVGGYLSMIGREHRVWEGDVSVVLHTVNRKWPPLLGRQETVHQQLAFNQQLMLSYTKTLANAQCTKY